MTIRWRRSQSVWKARGFASPMGSFCRPASLKFPRAHPRGALMCPKGARRCTAARALRCTGTRAPRSCALPHARPRRTAAPKFTCRSARPTAAAACGVSATRAARGRRPCATGGRRRRTARACDRRGAAWDRSQRRRTTAPAGWLRMAGWLGGNSGDGGCAPMLALCCCLLRIIRIHSESGECEIEYSTDSLDQKSPG